MIFSYQTTIDKLIKQVNQTIICLTRTLPPPLPTSPQKKTIYKLKNDYNKYNFFFSFSHPPGCRSFEMEESRLQIIVINFKNIYCNIIKHDKEKREREREKN